MPTIIVLGGRQSGPTIKEIEEKAAKNLEDFMTLFTQAAADPTAAKFAPDIHYYASHANAFFEEGDIPNTILFLMRALALLQLEGKHEPLNRLDPNTPTTTH